MCYSSISSSRSSFFFSVPCWLNVCRHMLPLWFQHCLPVTQKSFSLCRFKNISLLCVCFESSSNLILLKYMLLSKYAQVCRFSYRVFHICFKCFVTHCWRASQKVSKIIPITKEIVLDWTGCWLKAYCRNAFTKPDWW